jgi:hypothetical protein
MQQTGTSAGCPPNCHWAAQQRLRTLTAPKRTTQEKFIMKPSNAIIQSRLFAALLALGLSIAFAIAASVVSSVARAAPPPQCPAGKIIDLQTHACVPVKPPAAPAAPTPVLKAPIATVHLPANGGKPNCPQPPPCPSNAGTCQLIAGCMTATPATCAPGYYGLACAACPGGAKNSCSSNGYCNQGMSGSGACNCYAGFTGAACQYSNAITCSGHGSANFNGSCVCESGYSGPSCKS